MVKMEYRVQPVFKELNIDVLPNEVTVPIKQKNQEVLGRFDENEPRNFPHIVIVLERSAVLPSLSLIKEKLIEYLRKIYNFFFKIYLVAL